jgi:hypothetical protein
MLWNNLDAHKTIRFLDFLICESNKFANQRFAKIINDLRDNVV